MAVLGVRIWVIYQRSFTSLKRLVTRDAREVLGLARNMQICTFYKKSNPTAFYFRFFCPKTYFRNKFEKCPSKRRSTITTKTQNKHSFSHQRSNRTSHFQAPRSSGVFNISAWYAMSLDTFRTRRISLATLEAQENKIATHRVLFMA